MNSTRTVLLTNPIDSSGVELLKQGNCNVVYTSDQGADTLRAMSADAEVIIVRSRLPDDILAHAPKLRGFVRHGVGVDFIPVAKATAHGLPVVNAPGTNAIAVAEYVFSGMHALQRSVRAIDGQLREERWVRARQPADSSQELHGQTIGIVGLGNVGKAVARIAHFGYGMTVLGCQRNLQSMPEYVRPTSLESLFSNSRYIVLCCPLTHETEGMVDKSLLSLVAPFSYLINVGRGQLIDEMALVEALSNQSLAGAVLDVFSEQPLKPNHPFLSTPNLLLTPHVAGITAQSMTRMSVLAAEETLRILDGKRPINLVNPEVWPS